MSDGLRVPSPARNYLFSVLTVALATTVAFLVFRRTELADIVMIYILGILIVATRLGRGPSLLASLLSVAAFDFLFIPPYFRFTVSDFRHVGTFAVMLLVGLVIGNLTERIRAAARTARAREQRAQALFRLGQELAQSSGAEALVGSAVRNVAEHFQCRAVVLLPDADGRLEAPPSLPEPYPDRQELALAQRVFDQAEARGTGSQAIPAGPAFYLPLRGSRGTLGVMGVADASRWTGTEPRQLLEAFANQTALALERSQLAEQSIADRRHADEERLRNALLSSVSHDLRTPLGVITGAVSTVLETPDLSEASRRDLLASAQEEAQRLHRLVSNLLDITRLEAGPLELQTEWIPIEEVVGAVLNRRELGMEANRIRTDLPEQLPPVAIDPVLMEQVLLNLLDNALKYSPPGSPVEVKGWTAEGMFALSVADRGCGIAAGEEERIFEKLARGEAAVGRPGAGLGLAICRGIITAHGGRIQACNRPQGGAEFLLTLPMGTPPDMPQEAT